MAELTKFWTRRRLWFVPGKCKKFS